MTIPKMSGPLISINLLTYNRLPLLRTAIASILDQSFRDFELLVYNNGSTDGTRDYLDSILDPRVRVFHHQPNNRLPFMEEQAEFCSGKYISPVFADDDMFAPHAFETLARTLAANPQVDSIQWRYALYDHDRCTLTLPKKLTSHLRFFGPDDCLDFFRYDLSGWGVGNYFDYRSPIPNLSAHSSCVLFRRDLLDRTRERQGKLFVPPLGDIGFVGTLLHTKQLCRIDLPLVAIGVHQQRDMANAIVNRQHFKPLAAQLEFSPLRGLSFTNLGVESHLRLLAWNGMALPRLRPCIFARHARSVLCDRPWTAQTMADIAELVPHLLASLYRFGPASLLRRLHARNSSATEDDPVEQQVFGSVDEAMAWLGNKLPK